MKLYLDSADLKQIESALQYGVISGITTNPSLLAKAGHKDVNQVIAYICNLVKGPVSVEVLGLTKEEMVGEALGLSAIHPNVVIKIPMVAEGLKAIKELKELGIKTNATLIFSASQGLLAALAGANYISPFLGRLDDINSDGLLLVEELAQIIHLHDLKTEIIAASIRNSLHVTGAALAGAHIATVPLKILEQMLAHPLTDLGLKKFLEDWQKAKDEI